jgi:hypothetical protein
LHGKFKSNQLSILLTPALKLLSAKSPLSQKLKPAISQCLPSIVLGLTLATSNYEKEIYLTKTIQDLIHYGMVKLDLQELNPMLISILVGNRFQDNEDQIRRELFRVNIFWHSCTGLLSIDLIVITLFFIKLLKNPDF